MKNEVGIVVSRYYEDLRWIENITSNVDVYVYNRSGESPGMGVPNAVAWAKPKDPNDVLGGLDIERCKANGINLEIIDIPDDPGFEASTYAYHCYSKYKQLNDYTVFIQAHPEIYVSNVIDIFNNPEQIKHTFYKRLINAESSPSTFVVDLDNLIEFQLFSDTIVRCGLDNYNWRLYENDYSVMPWLEFCKNMPHSYDSNKKWMPIQRWDFAAGNQFIVSKRAIHINNVTFYKKIQNFVNSYMDPLSDQRPTWQQLNQGPNVMEGIWPFIFNKINN